VPAVTDGRPRILLVYADRIAVRMGGVGIRALELARALAPHADVTIAGASTDGADLGVRVATFEPHAPTALRPLLRSATAVVAQPQWPWAMRLFAQSDARLIFDLYDPELFGTLEHFAGRPPLLRRTMAAFAADRLRDALRLGDHVICAGERQRDLWLGAMLGMGAVTPALYERDPSLRSVLDTVPFGVPETPATSDGPGPRERFGLPPDAEVLLWNGGLWSWFDPATAIRAFAALRERRPRAHLVFMGAADAPPAIRATEDARRVAAGHGLLDDGVWFNDRWVPYEQRAAWLAQSAALVSTHLDHLETRFAYRTRLLDGLWAGVPIVCTSGDELGDRVAADGLGATAAPGDVAGLAAAMDDVLAAGRARYAGALRRAAERQRWSRVVAPLVRWTTPDAPAPRRPDRPQNLPAARGRAIAYRGAARAFAALPLGPPRLRR
jgi:glycosyltransferase involved in cell wall biosynthesis